MKLIQKEEDGLTLADDFDIHTPVKGRPRKYADYSITLGAKKFDGRWHYWWLTTVDGKEYGSVFVADIYHKNIKNLSYVTAVKSIDKILASKQKIKEVMEGK